MAGIPAPPTDLAVCTPLRVEVAVGEVWYRSHKLNRGPIHFGKAKSQRWDAPNGEYGVLYLAKDPFGAFMESIGRNYIRTKLIDRLDLENRGLSQIRITRPLQLIDIAESGGLTRIGADAQLTSNPDYPATQQWSLALNQHPCQPEGIYYRSRHDVARYACALFDSCEPALESVGAPVPWLDNPALLGRILDHYQLALDLA